MKKITIQKKEVVSTIRESKKEALVSKKAAKYFGISKAEAFRRGMVLLVKTIPM